MRIVIQSHLLPTKEPFILGTAIKIIVLLDIDTATTSTITIEDPSRTDKITAVNMTKETDGVYSYIYQSSEDDNDGTYVVTISVLYDGYTSIEEKTFETTDPFDSVD